MPVAVVFSATVAVLTEAASVGASLTLVMAIETSVETGVEPGTPRKTGCSFAAPHYLSLD
jgi:hypothetical protein